MNIHKLDNFKGGWFIGNFDPSILKTDQFEVGLKFHQKDEDWPNHYHKIATEYNLLISGKLIVNGVDINAGEIFVVDPLENAKCNFVEDCYILVVKAPCVKNDKFLVDNPNNSNT